MSIQGLKAVLVFWTKGLLVISLITFYGFIMALSMEHNQPLLFIFWAIFPIACIFSYLIYQDNK